MAQGGTPRGGGPGYEKHARDWPDAQSLVQEVRRERIDQVVARRTRTFTVVLERLEDSFNMAAVLRTCEGLGVQEVHVIPNPEAPFIPNSRVAQGCDKWLDIRMHADFGRCREHLAGRGFTLLASALREGSQSLYALSFDRPLALVFGNERFGVSEEVLSQAHGTFWIPMRGFSQSLNISVAAGMCIGRMVAWREEHLGSPGDLGPGEAQALRERFYVLSVKQRKRIFKGQPPP